MIIRNRLFERIAPSREAKSIYIFCEGADREYNYFKYFIELDSRINLKVYKLSPHQNNSPLGLYEIAQSSLITSKNNPNPIYEFQENDEVWIVLDTDRDKNDSRRKQIDDVKNSIKELKGWNLAESNPCFEVWLYYHFNNKLAVFNELDKCKSWKPFVDKNLKGGFDPRKHPILIETASENAKDNFRVDDKNKPTVGTTEVFYLADSILKIVGSKIRIELNKLT
jgi:hypothetical protein